MKIGSLPQIKGSKKWQLLGRDSHVVFHRIKSFIVIYILNKNGTFSLQKKSKMICNKLIEDPRSLLLNQRRFYSVFSISDKDSSLGKSRIKTPSIRLFHNKTPAIDFLQTKSLVKGSQNYIKETVYQSFLNSAAWNYCNQKPRESTFNLETKHVFDFRQKDHNCFPTGSAIMQRLQY